MPALSRRTSEFRPITLALVDELSRESGRPAPALSDDAWKRLQGYDWPGNLRELRNVLQVALTTCQPGRIDASDFPQFGYDRTEFHATREAFERTYLEELLRTASGSLERAAELSGMPVSTIAAKAAK